MWAASIQAILTVWLICLFHQEIALCKFGTTPLCVTWLQGYICGGFCGGDFFCQLTYVLYYNQKITKENASDRNIMSTCSSSEKAENGWQENDGKINKKV